MNAAGEMVNESRAFKRERDVLSSTIIIYARFVSLPPLELKIKYKKHNHLMKTSGLNSDNQQTPSLFQIASYFEDFFPPTGVRRLAPAFRQMPFARLMMHPGKLKAVLAPAKTGTPAASPGSAKRPPRNTPKTNTGGDGKSSNDLSPEARRINFQLKSSRPDQSGPVPVSQTGKIPTEVEAVS
jgi:hypothetical protein